MGHLHRALVFIITVLLAALVLIVSLQVMGRFIPFLPYMLWTEEISRFLLIWLIFIGASVGVKETTHFVVNIFRDPHSRTLRTAWNIFVILGMGSIAWIFMYRGFSYAMVLLYDISDIAQISMLWVGAAIPLFGFLSVLFLLDQLFTTILQESER